MVEYVTAFCVFVGVTLTSAALVLGLLKILESFK